MARARRVAFTLWGLGLLLLPALSIAVPPAKPCHSEVACLDATEPNCVPVPTSLRPLTLRTDTDLGWSPGTACGTKSCFAILRCACGNLLSKDVCDGPGGGVCDCGPGTDTPCTYAVQDLNKMLDPSKKAQKLHTEASNQNAEALFMPELGSRELAGGYAGTLNRLRDFYQKLTSAHVEAGVWLNFPDRAGEGTFEYWFEGQKYRQRAIADARLGLSPAVVAAYDGERYQLLFEEDSRLSLYRENPGQTPAPYMNPLFLPIAFLSPEGDDCPLCELTLDAIKDEKRWRMRVGEARGLPEKSGEGTIILPGGRLEGESFYFRLTLLPKRDLVSKIEYVRPNGVVFRVVSFSHYAAAQGTTYPFPRHMMVTGNDAKGRWILSLHVMVKELQINKPIEAEKFTIPFSEVRTVIDEDAPTFLQHRQLEKN
jgi:hypothetical protein